MKSQRRKKPAGTSKSHQNVALVLIDSAPIREQARREYQQALDDLKTAREELDHFLKEDRPRFSQWLNSTFGSVLSEIRELHQKLQTKQQLILTVEAEAWVNDVSFGEAYRTVLKNIEAGTPPEDESFFDDEFGPEPGPEKRHGRAREDREEPQDETRSHHFSKPKRSSEASPENGRLKELYRAVVRNLHPDTQTEMTAQKLEWWHQAQDAYQKGDEEQLEIILALCQTDNPASKLHTTVSLLIRIAKHLRATIRLIGKQLREHRRDPAWRFTKRNNLNKLASEMRKQLDRERLELEFALEVAEDQLEDWEEQSKRERRRKRSKRNRDDFFY